MTSKFSFTNWRLKSLVPFLVILGFSASLCLVQLVTRGAIIGSDAVFHYNRFYDTAMQIKEGSYHNIISIYGFQQTGRIVNALYGPYFAYFQGLLLLISGTWFNYQILSRILLSTIAGLSLFTLLKKAGVKEQLSLLLSLFFLTTFAIQYWSLRQGFSSWGIAFFPLALTPAINYVKKGQIASLQLGLAVALILQVHVLSTLFLVLTYIPFFSYAFLASQQKWQDIKKIALAIGLFLLLSLNVVVPLLQISLENTLIQPFVNKNLPLYTLSRRSFVLLFQPIPLVGLLLAVVIWGCYRWAKAGRLERSAFITLLALLFLSSSYTFWAFLAPTKFTLVELIQFPFRFFLPATVLLLLLAGLYLSAPSKWQKHLYHLCLVATLLSALQVLHTDYLTLQNGYFSNHPVQSRVHTVIYGSPEQIRQAIHSTNLKEFLQVVVKPTPDYLPKYEETDQNKYNLYQELVIDNSQKFTKIIENGQLTIRWTSSETGQINIPVIVYHNTRLSLNQTELDKADYTLTAIGTVEVQQRVGQNELVLSYPSQIPITLANYLTITGWLLSLVWLFLKKPTGYSTKSKTNYPYTQ